MPIRRDSSIPALDNRCPSRPSDKVLAEMEWTGHVTARIIGVWCLKLCRVVRPITQPRISSKDPVTLATGLSDGINSGRSLTAEQS